jgi:hypothetical protein
LGAALYEAAVGIFFCKCLFTVAATCKYEDENRVFVAEWEEVERNLLKYFVPQTRTVIKASCVSRTSDVGEPSCGHPWHIASDEGNSELEMIRKEAIVA